MKKISAILLCVMLALCALAGCAAAPSAPSAENGAGWDGGYDYTADAPVTDAPAIEEAVTESDAMEDAAAGVGELDPVKPAETDRKLIYTANYVMETGDMEATYNGLLAAVEAAGGYVSSERMTGTAPEEYGDSGRSAYITVRVPVDNFNAFTEALAGVGEVTERYLDSDDVTDEYFDVDARIEMLEGRLERLYEHLDAAAKMSDIIELETEISNVLYELDTYKGTMRRYNDLIQYSTVNIDIYERVRQSAVTVSGDDSFGTRVSEGLSGVLNALGTFFTGFAVVFISALPILAILAAITLAIVLPIYFSRKRKRAKQKAAEEAAAAAPKEPEKAD